MPSTAHVHLEPVGTQLAKAARAVLEGQSEQWTEMRQAVFALLAGQDRPLSAYDLADMLSGVRGRRVAPNSIYRILDLFVANNLALRIESANAYMVNAHPGCRHDCIFLVCRDCGGATHVDEDAVSREVRAIADRSGFAAERPVVEVLGICADCRPAATGETA